LDLSVLSGELQQFSASCNELLLQVLAKSADDYSSIDRKRDLCCSSFADSLRNLFVDGIAYRNKTEECSVLFGSKVEWLRGYFINPVIESEEGGILFVEVRFKLMGNAYPIERRTSIVDRYQFSALIEQGKKVASAHLPELDATVFDRSGIVGGH
jgi:hypothetical protein